MKKVKPIALALVIIFGLLYLLNQNKPSLVSYSATNPQKYNTTPSPTTTNLKTYVNQDYGISLDYPKRSLNPQNELVECGNFISSSTKLLAPNESLIVDNIAIIEIVSWGKSIDEYINSLGAKGIYNTSRIMASNADDAIKIDGLKTPWTGPGIVPMSYVSDIYQKDSHLFLVQYPGDFINNGCINPGFVGESAPFPIDRTWKIEDHLRFN